jgi:hypothetical protein
MVYYYGVLWRSCPSFFPLNGDCADCANTFGVVKSAIDSKYWNECLSSDS